MWSKKHSACVECGTTEFPHRSKGLCKTCYYRLRREDPVIHQRQLENHRRWRSNPENKAKEKAYRQQPHIKEKDNQRSKDRYWENHEKYSKYSRDWHRRKKYGENGIKAFERDNETCQKCNSIDNLVIHHKDWNDQNNVLCNLITLCRSCHTRVHQWVPSRLRVEIFNEWITN